MNKLNKKYSHIANEVRDEYTNMKEFNPKKKFVLGLDSKGQKFTVGYLNHAFCERKNLVKIEIPEMCKSLYCEGNHLTELKLQHTMVEVWCFENNITELHVPEGVEDLRCDSNLITSLNLPSSLDWLTCDKELFDYDKCHVKVVNIIYER